MSASRSSTPVWASMRACEFADASVEVAGDAGGQLLLECGRAFVGGAELGLAGLDPCGQGVELVGEQARCGRRGGHLRGALVVRIEAAVHLADALVDALRELLFELVLQVCGRHIGQTLLERRGAVACGLQLGLVGGEAHFHVGQMIGEGVVHGHARGERRELRVQLVVVLGAHLGKPRFQLVGLGAGFGGLGLAGGHASGQVDDALAELFGERRGHRELLDALVDLGRVDRALLQQADPLAERAQLVGHLGLCADARTEHDVLLVQLVDGRRAGGELLEPGGQLVVGLRRRGGELGHLFDAARQCAELRRQLGRLDAAAGRRRARLDFDDALVQFVDLAADRIGGVEPVLQALDLLDDLGRVALRRVRQDHRGRGDRAEPIFQDRLGLLAGVEPLFQLDELDAQHRDVGAFDRWLLLEQSHGSAPMVGGWVTSNRNPYPLLFGELGATTGAVPRNRGRVAKPTRRGTGGVADR